MPPSLIWRGAQRRALQSELGCLRSIVGQLGVDYVLKVVHHHFAPALEGLLEVIRDEL